MKVAGFTFVKNALIYDYPIVEAIQSILPICDEVVVAVGKSEDDTLQLIQGISSDKIRIIETVWDESLREGGRVLAVETDKAYHAISKDVDWAFYIQGDEVIHEDYLDAVKSAMKAYQHDSRVDGFLFKYKHFYASYDYVGASAKWYANEIRVVRRNDEIYSYKDAQGFRKGDNEKLNVIAIDAEMYHYGWVKDPKAMQLKQENFNKLWHDDQWIEDNVVKADAFDYSADVRALRKFEGDHPQVMQPRIKEKNWSFDKDISMGKLSLKDRLKHFLRNVFGIDTGHGNYRLVRPKKPRTN